MKKQAEQWLEAASDDLKVIEKIMNVVNQYSLEGKEIEILDDMTFGIERKMILKSLTEEQDNQVTSHDDVWNELLE